jgi:hypothetical protein
VTPIFLPGNDKIIVSKEGDKIILTVPKKE